ELTGTATSNTSSSRSAPRSPGFRDEPFFASARLNPRACTLVRFYVSTSLRFCAFALLRFCAFALLRFRAFELSSF
ncbi:hypothetical protein, partial [Burkholderia pseudomallei]|uniref:hypothetical protein n=1 Tax=Burkholderia pseudomallei TaxID=28450 RepID=UPI001177C972